MSFEIIITDAAFFGKLEFPAKRSNLRLAYFFLLRSRDGVDLSDLENV